MKNILAVTLEIKENYKGQISSKKVNICTPFSGELCGFMKFKTGETFLIYGTIVDFADIYFIYGINDYLKVKSKYKFWTNYCQGTNITNWEEKDRLLKLFGKK